MRSHPLFLSFLSLPLTKCPPNECCSKWDLRSTTKELCGDKTVKHPSGETRAEHMGRAAGYYQVSVSPRTPQAFQPEDIPLGIYTHLNFAFASIDPKTYQIVPASASDAALYKRLTDLKEKDRELKVYISIGRWTAGYPIPGLSRPAFNTFSNLVASEVHQRAFFVSLIQFMNKYNFDGVDWEFPVNSDQWGNGVHFANFPTFLRNLRSALDEGAGARNGVSVMVPVAFGHLRKYDLQDITPWIDFYNIITYDSLHGLSDDGNSWIGDYFDSPTRMTNIARHLDVFWRNKVPLEKLTLNLAFYPRTSTADDPGCRQPQCIFDAVVKMATYDVWDTSKVKIDIPRCMCLGGRSEGLATENDGLFFNNIGRTESSGKVNKAGNAPLPIAPRLPEHYPFASLNWPYGGHLLGENLQGLHQKLKYPVHLRAEAKKDAQSRVRHFGKEGGALNFNSHSDYIFVDPAAADDATASDGTHPGRGLVAVKGFDFRKREDRERWYDETVAAMRGKSGLERRYADAYAFRDAVMASKTGGEDRTETDYELS